MRRQLKFVIWFPIVLVTAFAAGYLFWQQTLIPGPYDLEPMTVVRNHRATSIDTSNWQTYRNEKYEFEVKYPADGYVIEEGPDPYEQRFLQKKTVSGTQEPLVEQIRVGFRDQDFAVFIDIPDHKNFPVIQGDYGWWLRPCGQEGFAEIKSRIEANFKGYKTLLVTSTWDEGARDVRYYCVNFPQNPIIIYFLSELKTQAEQILSTFKFIEPGSKEGKVCVQVITPAKNPQTGEVRNFPTPCDVPEGWELVR